jgi:hypothetical protein
MSILSGGPQQSYAGTPEPKEETPRRRLARAVRAEAAAPSRPERIGIVCVHGIGSQRPGETLLDWSRPIVKVLTDWIAAHRAQDGPPGSVHVDPATVRDPVATSHVDFSGGQLPIVEIAVPAATGDDGATWPAQTWVMTEAWWAARVQPPSLGSMTDWIRKDFGRVVEGIRAGIGEEQKRERLRAAAAEGPQQKAWIGRLDELTVARIRPLLTLLWGLAYLLLLVPYALVRSLPIGPLKDAAGLRQLDTFLVDWFGDMRILLRDPAQAANVRGRLADAIRALRLDYRCDRVIVIAHSGGALVSFTTLTDGAYLADPRFEGLKVDKLITHGQALALAWRLSNVVGGVPVGDRLGGKMATSQPDLRWVDFWSTYDPAPGGRFQAPDDLDLEVDSVAVRNRMSILDDHGGYWDNDEEFLVPLVRQIETVGRDVESSRFFRNEVEQRGRVVHRTERVATLAAWRWVIALGGLVALGIAALRTVFTHTDRLGDIGRWAVGLATSIPGHEILSAPIDAVASALALVPDIPDRGVALAGGVVLGLVLGVAAWLVPRLVLGERWHAIASRPELRRLDPPVLRPTLWAGLIVGLLAWFVVPGDLARAMTNIASPAGGQWAAGIATICLAFFALAKVGSGRWGQWDADERWRLRQDPPLALDRGRPRTEGALLVAAAVVLAVILAVY